MKNQDASWRALVQVLCIFGLLLVLFSGCTTLDRFFAEPEEERRRSAAGASAAPEKKPELPALEYEYSREEFIKALVQLDEMRESAEFVQQFMWGDEVFEDSIASITWLSTPPVLEGTGATLVFYDEEGWEYRRISHGWVDMDPRSGSWWKMSQHSQDLQFSCEVRLNADGIPQEVFLLNEASGERIQRRTFYSQMEISASGDSSPAQPASLAEEKADMSWFERIRREEYQAAVTPLYAGLEIEGEETLWAAGRWFRAVKMSSAPGPDGRQLEAWFSPHVPGKVLRIALNEDRVIAELIWVSEEFSLEIAE